MEGIIFTDKAEFGKVNNKIHLAMQENLEGYNATEWANVDVTPLNKVTNGFMLPIEEDVKRNNIITNVLSKDELGSIVTIDEKSEDWIPEEKV